MKFLEQWGIKLFKRADIVVNGTRPWDIQVYNNKFFWRLFNNGTIAVGESYMDGWWDCERIDQFIYKCLGAGLDRRIPVPLADRVKLLKARFVNEQTKSLSSKDVHFHYDLGNNLFRNMLDKRMNYSCAYWKNADSLEKAQENKLDLVCRKLKLKKGMRVLEIGCGWGNFAKYAAEKYGVKIVGVTASKEQAKFARRNIGNLDVEIRLEDYRNIQGKFDAVVSIAMLEAVGHKNFRCFMEVVDRHLDNEGLFLLHTIGESVSVVKNDPWLAKYIFPGTMSPSAVQLTKSSEGIFVIEDWHNFGKDYDKTLLAWHKNFNNNWQNIKNKYDQRFFRMWNFYLLCCAAAFRSGRYHLWQIVFSKINSDKKYDRVC